MGDKVLVFDIDGFRLGLDASCVAQIEALPPLTAVPALPEYIAGVANLHGEIVPVVDLATLWGLPHRGPYRCILLLRHMGLDVALMADRAIEMKSNADALESAGAEAGMGRYILGLLPDQTTVVSVDLLLDAVLGKVEE